MFNSITDLDVKQLSNDELLKVSMQLLQELDSRKCKDNEVVKLDNTIEFEGKKLKLVDRKAKAGDYVVFNGLDDDYEDTKNNKFYFVIEKNNTNDPLYKTERVYNKRVYYWTLSCPNPKVYEVVEDNSQLSMNNSVPDKSNIQLRKEAIQYAKDYVKSDRDVWKNHLNSKVDFYRKGNKITCVVIGGSTGDRYIGRSICEEEDVFNYDIGCAIALMKANNKKNKLIEELVNVPNPDEFVEGQRVLYEKIENHYKEYNHIDKKEEGMIWFIDNSGVIEKDLNKVYKMTILEDSGVEY